MFIEYFDAHRNGWANPEKDAESFFKGLQAAGKPQALQLAEPLQIGGPDLTAQGKPGATPLALDLDQTGLA